MASGLIPTNAPNIPGAPNVIPGAPSVVPGTPSTISGTPTSTRLRDMQGRFVTGGYGWEWKNLVEFFDLPEEFGEELLDQTWEHVQELAEEIQDYAQENAPWTDRTGDARDGLKAVAIKRGEYGFEINLGYSVNYGYYLETHNGGEFAIVTPTLRQYAPQLLALNQGAISEANALPGGIE